jgi:hypothetical protein
VARQASGRAGTSSSSRSSWSPSQSQKLPHILSRVSILALVYFPYKVTIAETFRKCAWSGRRRYLAGLACLATAPAHPPIHLPGFTPCACVGWVMRTRAACPLMRPRAACPLHPWARLALSLGSIQCTTNESRSANV